MKASRIGEACNGDIGDLLLLDVLQGVESNGSHQDDAFDNELPVGGDA